MPYTFLLGDPGLPTPAELRLDRLAVFAGLTVVTNTHHTNRPRHATPCHAVRSNSQRIYATRAMPAKTLETAAAKLLQARRFSRWLTDEDTDTAAMTSGSLITAVTDEMTGQTNDVVVQSVQSAGTKRSPSPVI